MSGSTIQLCGFPDTVSTEEVTQFLETKTGEAGIVAREVRPMSMEPRSRLSAVVQFTSAKLAEDVSSKAQQLLLWYKDSYLTVKLNRQSTMFQVERAVLHVCCQVSDDRFSILWSVKDVAVNFGFESRKLQFFFHYHGFEYKLDLFYGDIRQIQLHHHHDQENKFILIQLKAAPRIYKKVENKPRDQWVRETDFTPYCSIGQSPTLFLEIPYTWELRDIRANFTYFKESEERFTLVGGDSSLCPDLVPIIEPPQDIQSPYNIPFKVKSLIQKEIIMRPKLDDEFFGQLNPYSINKDALEALSHLKEICFEPVSSLREQYRKYEMSGNHPKSATAPLELGLVCVHRVHQVTVLIWMLQTACLLRLKTTMNSLLKLFLIIFKALLAYLIKVAIMFKGCLDSPSNSSLLENQTSELPFSTSICSCRNKGEARVFYDAYITSYQKLKEAEYEILSLKSQITQFTESIQYFQDNYYRCRDEALQWREFVYKYLGNPASYPSEGINRIESYNDLNPQPGEFDATSWEENWNNQVEEQPQDDELQEGEGEQGQGEHEEPEEVEMEYDEWEVEE